jgi:hypothetical protein
MESAIVVANEFRLIAASNPLLLTELIPISGSGTALFIWNFDANSRPNEYTVAELESQSYKALANEISHEAPLRMCKLVTNFKSSSLGCLQMDNFTVCKGMLSKLVATEAVVQIFDFAFHSLVSAHAIHSECSA